MQGSSSPAKKGLPSYSGGPQPLPRHVVADEAHRPPCLRARGVETQVAQQPQDVHRGVPPAIPSRASPPAIGVLQAEQPCAPAPGGDPCTLGRDLIRRRTCQVPHHLPADRRVRVEQPVNDAHRSPSRSGMHPPIGTMLLPSAFDNPDLFIESAQEPIPTVLL